MILSQKLGPSARPHFRHEVRVLADTYSVLRTTTAAPAALPAVHAAADTATAGSASPATAWNDGRDSAAIATPRASKPASTCHSLGSDVDASEGSTRTVAGSGYGALSVTDGNIGSAHPLARAS